MRPRLTAAVLVLAFPVSASAQGPRTTIKAIGAGVLGSDVASTALVGGGLTVERSDLLQFFAEATVELGHTYPADTPRPATAATGEPVFVIITDRPLGLLPRVHATYFGGLRLITPPDRTFVAAAAGLATYKGTTLSYPDFLPSRYYTENRGIWAVGGGLSTMVGERWVLEGEYRWCQQWSEFARPSFHRVQASLGLAF